MAPDELAGVYRRFDVVAVPSLETPSWIEQFGRVAVEAMASGVAVVASDSGSLPEVVADAGILVPPGDVGALAGALGTAAGPARGAGPPGRRRPAPGGPLRLGPGGGAPARALPHRGRGPVVTTVDVVVVTHNSAAHLDDALAPLLAPARPAPPLRSPRWWWSTTPRVTTRSARARHLGATVVAGRVNAGFAAAANRGAATRIGRGRPVPQPRRLGRARAARPPGRRPGAPSRLRRGGGPPRRVPADPSARRGPSHRWPGAWREALGWDRSEPRPAPGEVPGFVVGACFLVRRDAFEALGGFDERFWLYGEEADLCRRMGDGGWTGAHRRRRGLPRGRGQRRRHRGPGVRALPARLRALRGQARGRRPAVAVPPGRGGRVGGSRRRTRPGVAARATTGAAWPAWPGCRCRGRPRCGLDSPATAAPGAGLVVCSLEAWDEVWRRNQFLVRELLAADPDRRVLFVEPAFDVLHERRHPSRAGRGVRGLVPVEGRRAGGALRAGQVVAPAAGTLRRRQPATAGARRRPSAGLRTPRPVDQRPELRRAGARHGLAGHLRHHRRLDPRRGLAAGPAAGPGQRAATVRRTADRWWCARPVWPPAGVRRDPIWR